MIGDNRVLAVITARSGSKGLPDKNIRSFAGEPLLARPISIAQQCNWVDRTILSTDSREYAAIGSAFGAEVPFLRSADLAADTASSIDVLIDILDRLEKTGESYEYLLLLEPTSPLTTERVVTEAMNQLIQTPKAESILGIKEVLTEHPAFCIELLEEKLMKPYVQEDFSQPLRRQELSKLFCFSGSFYLSTVKSLREHRCFYHERALGYVMPAWQAHEIDDLADFICAEALYIKRELFSDEC